MPQNRTLPRRALLSGLAASLALPVLAQQKKSAPKPAESDHGWYKLRSDEGKPFPNLRLPNELAREVERLPGLIRAGSDTPDATLVAFTDYNCPWCRKAAKELAAMLQEDADLRLGLVNNAILSPASKEAARVEIAVIKHYGRKDAYALHMAALGLSGLVDGRRTLDLAAGLGLDRAILTEAASTDPEVAEALDRQMKLADGMAFTTTPCFMIGTAGVIGYPGPRAMRSMVAAMRKCEMIACG
jgi:protein-disulfide isomerase